MKKTLLLILFALFPFIAYADGSIQFSLINFSASTIPNPIKVTGGYIQYYFLPAGAQKLPDHCPLINNPAIANLSSIVNTWPLPIYLGTESKFTFPDPSMSDCLVKGSGLDGSSLFATLFITQVDGINKLDGVCTAAGYTSGGYNTFYNLNIEETTDNFYCSMVSRE
jgi:hypothetical protein